MKIERLNKLSLRDGQSDIATPRAPVWAKKLKLIEFSIKWGDLFEPFTNGLKCLSTASYLPTEGSQQWEHKIHMFTCNV